MNTVPDALKTIQFVVDREGHPTAVIMDIASWESLIAWIEDLTDVQIATRGLEVLAQAGGRPEQAGWLNWDDICEEWDDEEESISESL